MSKELQKCEYWQKENGHPKVSLQCLDIHLQPAVLVYLTKISVKQRILCSACQIRTTSCPQLRQGHFLAQWLTFVTKKVNTLWRKANDNFNNTLLRNSKPSVCSMNNCHNLSLLSSPKMFLLILKGKIQIIFFSFVVTGVCFGG